MKRLLALVLCLSLSLGLFSACGTDKTDSYTPTGDGLTQEGDLIGPTAPEQEEEPQKMTLIWYPDRTLNPYTCTDFTNQALFSLLYQSLFTI